MTICVHCVHWFKVEENMMEIEQTNIYCAFQSGIHALRWCICHSRGIPGPEWSIHTASQLIKVGLIQIQERHSGLDCRSQLCQQINHRPANTWERKLQLCHEYLSRVTVSYTVGCGSGMCPNIDDMPANAATLLRISEPVSHILRQVHNRA